MAKEVSAGVVVIRPGAGGWQFLLLRAYHSWDFPKGRIESGESAFDAALREVEEETGVRHLDFRWGLDWRETAPYRAGKVARYYLATTPDVVTRLPINPKLQRPEHHEFRWVSLAKARVLVAPRLQPILDWAEEKLRGDAA